MTSEGLARGQGINNKILTLFIHYNDKIQVSVPENALFIEPILMLTLFISA